MMSRIFQTLYYWNLCHCFSFSLIKPILSLLLLLLLWLTQSSSARLPELYTRTYARAKQQTVVKAEQGLTEVWQQLLLFPFVDIYTINCSVTTFLMGKGKVYIIHIYFQIAMFLKTGVYLYIYQAYIVDMLIFSHEFVMVYNKIQHIYCNFQLPH